jgi:hypothetical protein
MEYGVCRPNEQNEDKLETKRNKITITITHGL